MGGKLYIVSSGPASQELMTQEALNAIDESNLIVAYTRYAKDLKHLFSDKELITSGMTKEIERCKIAIDRAVGGDTVSLISNGDVNVFAMASLVVELVDELELWDKLEVQSIAGVTSMLSAASKCGAPISQDFAIISLSDRLTDIEVIKKRVVNAIDADFVVGIYNPLSKSRKKPYIMFLEALKNKKESTPVIIASNLTRENEKLTITDVKELIEAGVENPIISMSTLVIVGNDSTRLTKNQKVLTPRGYLKKYNLEGDKK